MKRMLFNATHQEELRVAIVDGQKLIDLDIETAGREQRKGNIYKGVITRIEPGLEACFVSYGEERHGFLPFKEVARSYFKEGIDARGASIQEALREGQELIVQVEKEERGNKGAALTTFISLAGRYLVLMPNNPRGGGVSRRVEGDDRQELREAMEQLDVPQGMSIIARTAGIGRSVEELQWDLAYLMQLWTAIDTASRENAAPILIYLESSLVIRAIRDYFSPEIGEILIDTEEIAEQAQAFMGVVMPDNLHRVKMYRDDIPLFSRFQIEHQIETAYSRTVQLPSGGAVVIDHTEALVAIDVNSARSTRGADIEETALRTNLEAADEVARQLRLRDLGGLIVIDFIDMEDNKNQRAVEQRLRDALHFDRARVQMGKISRFGLMELSRQRLRPALNEGSHITCPRCNGTGVIRDAESSALHVLRLLQEEAMKENTAALHAQVPVEVATYLLNEKRNDITKIESRLKVNLVLIPNKNLETPHHHIERLRHDDPRLEDNKSSFDLAQAPSTLVDWNPNKHEEAKQRPEALVKGITPSQPAPPPRAQAAAPAAAPAAQHAAKPGLFTRLLSWLSGSAANDEAPAAPATEKPKSNGQGNRRGQGQGQGNRERNGRGDGKRERGAQPAQAGDRDRSSSRNRRNDRRQDEEGTETRQANAGGNRNTANTGNGNGRPPRRNQAEAPAVAETPNVAAQTPADDASENPSGRNGRSRRGRGRGRREEGAVVDTVANVDTTVDVAQAEAPHAAAPIQAVTSSVLVPVTDDHTPLDTDDTDLDTTGEDIDASADSESGDAERGKRRRRRGRRGRRNSDGTAAETTAGEGEALTEDAASVAPADNADAPATPAPVLVPEAPEAAAETEATPFVPHETPKFNPEAITFPADNGVSEPATEAVAQAVTTTPESAPAAPVQPQAIASEQIVETVAAAPVETTRELPVPVATEPVQTETPAAVADEVQPVAVTAPVIETPAAPVADTAVAHNTAPQAAQAADLQEIADGAGLQLVETRSLPVQAEAPEAAAPRLGRPRRRQASSADEPLQQVETQ